MKILISLFFTWAVISSPVSFAQSHNSAEHHRQWNPQHAGYDGNQTHSGSIIHIPNEVWENKYGAIAHDGQTGVVATVEDKSSLRAARREALRLCGGRGCKIVATATNACLAAGDAPHRIYVGSGLTLDEAVQKLHERCASEGNVCNVGYAYCNTPIRIR